MEVKLMMVLTLKIIFDMTCIVYTYKWTWMNIVNLTVRNYYCGSLLWLWRDELLGATDGNLLGTLRPAIVDTCELYDVVGRLWFRSVVMSSVFDNLTLQNWQFCAVVSSDFYERTLQLFRNLLQLIDCIISSSYWIFNSNV